MGTVHTIGHSTRTAEELIGLLRAYGVRVLVDVRRFPASRRHPHFGREVLGRTLEAAGVEYVHEEALGGRRAVEPQSINVGWRNRSFRGYADYMGTPPFAAALERLESRAAGKGTAILCAEAVPWRCHRGLIADALVARGHDVFHILGPDDARPHVMHEHARVRADGRVIYPAAGDEQIDLL